VSGRKSRDKGATWEREVARLLTSLTGFECSRRLRQYQVGGSDIETELPLAIECKTGYRISIKGALDQASKGAEAGEMPFVWGKQNCKGKGPSRYIAIKEEYFLPMLISHLRKWLIEVAEIEREFVDADLN